MRMKNIAIIGASYLQLPLIEKAQSMGFVTHVFAWKANDVGETAADYFYPISIVEREQILEKCREIGICGICSIGSDLAMLTVNYVAEKLGLPGNSMRATQLSTNKHLMRKAFFKHGDPSPRSIEVDASTDISKLTLDFPVIVKPTDRSGSRGIYKLDTIEGLEAAVRSSLSEGFEKKALIEEFAEGTEYSVEHISYQGKHYFLAMTLKFTTGAPHFIETGHLEPAPVDAATLERVKSVVSHALDSLEITDGASHAELKIDSSGQIKLIEIGGRMGGDCIGSDLVYYSTGYDFVKMVINVACGKAPDFTRYVKPQPVRVQFILTQDDLDLFDKMRQETPEKIIRVPYLKREAINQTTDSSNRAGCYIYYA